MNDSKISVRYARALFESAIEKNILAAVFDDMVFLAGVCRLPEMKEFLESPIIVPSKKTDIFHKVLGNNVDKLTLSFIDLVVKSGRETFLPAMARVFIHETKEHNGITETTLTTAVTVDDKIRKQVSELISGMFKTKVELNEVVDTDIIGGFVLKIEDNLIDASVRTKLRKIEKELKSRSLTA
jgi:F-type H+-transporting ATPase subunit delta